VPEDPQPDLSAVLATFDRVESNLVKLEAVWRQIERAIPEGVAFGLDTPEMAALYDSYRQLVDSLPAIDGFVITATPMLLDDIAHTRFGYWEIDEPLGLLSFDESVLEPARDLAVYRRRLEGQRRSLVRQHVMGVTEQIEAILRDVVLGDGIAEWSDADRWGELAAAVSELDRLTGALVPGNARWSDLHRHLHFGASNDLSDIVTMDWPSVRNELEQSLYDDREPLPIDVDDLGELVKARPTGPVSSKVDWSRITDDQFEGLVFEIVRHAEGYENANWLMRTNAADRGRDIEVHRVVQDPLAATRRYRVIVQCKHWQSKSVGRRDLIECAESITLWEPPKVDELIIATSGRFTQDAVAWAEKRNHERLVPTIELWPDNRLELLLARRPHIAAQFGLR
jgi:hypothetical protein